MGLPALMDYAIRAALLAGEKIMKVYSSGEFGIVHKQDLSPLTLADSQAHEVISTILASTQLPLLSEEGVHRPYEERKLWKSYWLVDPLDGTKEFINRNGEFAVNIALMQDNKPIAGVIYAPVAKELYLGIVHSGAWKIINPESDCTVVWIAHHGISLPTGIKDRPYTIAVSRSHFTAETIAFIDGIKKSHPDLQIIRKGSSLKFCLIADGLADSFPRFGPTMEWDTAAGHALVKATGKNIYLIDQHTEINYNKENLTNPTFIVL